MRVKVCMHLRSACRVRCMSCGQVTCRHLFQRSLAQLNPEAAHAAHGWAVARGEARAWAQERQRLLLLNAGRAEEGGREGAQVGGVA